MELKDIIKAAREEYGLTQQALAERIGCTVRTVRRWERGQRPSVQMLQRLRTVLHLSAAGLLEMADGPKELREMERRWREALGQEPALREALEPPAFGWRLRQAMSWRELKAADVAGYLGVSAVSVRRWMGGRLPLFAHQHLLAHLLDVPVWWLHTTYLDGCELFGHPAEHLHTERDEIARMRAVMLRPDGWTHTETDVDEAMLKRISAAHGLPVDDLRRVAYPLATPWRWRNAPFVLPVDAGSPLPKRLTEAIRSTRGLDGEQHSEARTRLFVSHLLNVAGETVARWAAGKAAPSAAQAHLLASALRIPSWRLWQLDT